MSNDSAFRSARRRSLQVADAHFGCRPPRALLLDLDPKPYIPHHTLPHHPPRHVSPRHTRLPKLPFAPKKYSPDQTRARRARDLHYGKPSSTAASFRSEWLLVNATEFILSRPVWCCFLLRHRFVDTCRNSSSAITPGCTQRTSANLYRTFLGPLMQQPQALVLSVTPRLFTPAFPYTR